MSKISEPIRNYTTRDPFLPGSCVSLRVESNRDVVIKEAKIPQAVELSDFTSQRSNEKFFRLQYGPLIPPLTGSFAGVLNQPSPSPFLPPDDAATNSASSPTDSLDPDVPDHEDA